MKRHRKDLNSHHCKKIRRLHLNSCKNHCGKDNCLACLPNDDTLESLLNLSAKVVASHIPFELIEKRIGRIPEPVQERIIYFSFPQEEKDIYIYSSYSSQSPERSNDGKEKLPYHLGVKLLESNLVHDVIQIGFHLSGVVKETCRHASSSSSKHAQNLHGFKVSISFDRCKIISVQCDCGDKGIFWCQHVVALTLFRIRRPDDVEFRVPISESLMQMDRQQLQKFAQYLIASHPNEVLPSAQRIADELLTRSSRINMICGAPDPTAGAGVGDANNWHLDEDQIREQVRQHLTNLACDETSTQLMAMCAKVREMFRVRDSNGARMLTIITEQFLSDPRLQVFKTRRTEMWQAYRQLWEELGSLWVCVLLNPLASGEERKRWRRLVAGWTSASACPSEDWEMDRDDDDDDEDDTQSGTEDNVCGPVPASMRRHSVFQLALTAANLSWHNELLQSILRSDEPSTMCWEESFPIACMRVHALRCNGFESEALRLAVAVARNLLRQRTNHPPPPPSKRSSSHSFNLGSECTPPISSSSYPSWGPCSQASITGPGLMLGRPSFGPIRSPATIESLSSPNSLALTGAVPMDYSSVNCPVGSASGRRGGGHSLDCPTNSEGWIGLPGDPLGCLVECLLEAGRNECSTTSGKGESSISAGGTSSSSSNGCGSSSKASYGHVAIPGFNPPAPSYLCLALQVAVMGLCQQRSMPSGLHRQEKALAQESRMLSLMSDLPSNDSLLNKTLLIVVKRELEAGCYSGLGEEVHTESFPMHATALWMFRRLHTLEQELSFLVASRAMRLPVLESLSDAEEPADFSSLMVSRFPRWAVLRSVESRQCDLAAAMILAARDSIQRLDAAMSICDRHLHTAASLFKLSQEVYSKASGHVYLLCAAFHLALNVCVRTLHRVNWRRREMVSWAVSCAVEVGPTAVLHLVTGWAHYASPREAAQLLAPALLSPAALLSYPPQSREQIGSAVRQVALQAAMKDPVHCSLQALTLTEKDPQAFESGYKLVCEAAERGAIGPGHLFTLGRYLEHRGCPQKAFTLALHAMRLFVLSSLQDSHPVANDVLWACMLAHSLGRSTLHEMICLVVRNVHCPTLLADILHRCSMTSPGTSEGSAQGKLLPLDRPPLRLLLDASLAAFVSTTQARLANISPRQYGEFLDFLAKARDTFHLIQPDGESQFRSLIDNMKQSYRGKRKLIYLLRERFGI